MNAATRVKNSKALKRVIVTGEMRKAGVKALQSWIGDDEQARFCGWDGLAVRDVFLRMHALFLKRQD